MWDMRFGGDDDDRLVEILPASSGGFLLCGWTRSAQGFDVTEPDRGFEDFWIVKVDDQGNKQWDKRFGTSGHEILEAAIVTPDGGFLLAGSSGPYSQALITPPDGDRTEAVLGYNDFWMVKIDANGTKQWDKRLGGPGAEILYAVINAPGGGYVLGGLPFLNAGGGQASSGDVSGSGYGNGDWWIVRTDARGNKLWDQLYGGTSQDYVRSLLATPDGGILAGGQSDSPVSGNKTVAAAGSVGWLLKLDMQGNKQWEQVYGPVAYGVAVNPAGGYFIGSGKAYSLMPPDADFWLASIDSRGLLQWERLYGGTGAEVITHIRSQANGEVLLFGVSDSNISRDKTASNRGGNDVWMVRVAASPLGTKEASAALHSKASLFPNPAESQIIVQVEGLNEQGVVRIEVLNSPGQLVQQAVAAAQSSTFQHQLDISGLSQGLYTLRVHTTDGVFTRKLVKN